MYQSYGNNYERKSPQKGGPLFPESSQRTATISGSSESRKQTYSKVFRWRLPDGQTQEPETVEVVGSFTHWQRVPMTRDGTLDAWHATLHHIEGNRTHHYMILVDGKPTQDKTADGLAVPHGQQEESYQLMTVRGPRVFLLFAQTK